jgi:putative ATP-binding cassette transporter
VYVWVRRTLALGIIYLSQKLFWKLRKQVLALILKASYQQLSTRKSRVYSVLVNDVNMLTSTSLSFIEFATASIVSIACLVYLASISLVLFAITLGIAIIGITVYQVGSVRNRRHFEKSRTLEDRFIENLNAILGGFKEIFLEPRKGKAIFEKKVNTIANDAFSNTTSALTGFLSNQITGQILFYVLISSVLIFFSVYLDISAAATVNYVFILLYLLSSIEAIMVLLPNIMRAKVSSSRVMNLRKELEEVNFDNNIPEKFMTRDEFLSISVKDLTYQYGETDQSFGIGPISFEVQKGETVFIYGGNGTGKTTFVHNIMGLRHPTAGETYLNGIPVDTTNYSYYRSIFTAVFSDFYLFKEVLVEEHFNEEKWYEYLKLFELDGLVKTEGSSFSTVDLSTGQRKRLALIVALLENKPVLVLDEWAADQDPYFRKKFYTEILPSLKQEGLTIIAITHDDKYYHCADKLYKMDYGCLVEEDVNVHATTALLSSNGTVLSNS